MLLFKKIVFILFCLLASFLGNVTLAQQAQFGIGLGMNNYWGDLQVESPTQNAFVLDPAVQFFYKQRLSANLHLRINAHFGRVHGDDSNSSNEDRQLRNLKFSSKVNEFSLSTEYDLWDLQKSFVTWTPFIGVGVGVFSFNPKTEYLHPDGRLLTIELQTLGTEGQGLPGQPEKYGLTALSIPVYGGLKFKINEKLSLSIELILRYTTTDYLDDVSTSYFPFESFPNTEIGQLASYLSNRSDEFLGLPENHPSSIRDAQLRGSAFANDFFHTGMITLAINLDRGIFGDGLGKGIDCYSF